jgi:hypothetical protein
MRCILLAGQRRRGFICDALMRKTGRLNGTVEAVASALRIGTSGAALRSLAVWTTLS